jgi:hypothetical protein
MAKSIFVFRTHLAHLAQYGYARRDPDLTSSINPQQNLPEPISTGAQPQPQPAPPPNYLNDIPSVHSSNGGVPAVLGNLDLNRSIQAGVPLDSENLVQAKLVAKGLRVMNGEFFL